MRLFAALAVATALTAAMTTPASAQSGIPEPTAARTAIEAAGIDVHSVTYNVAIGAVKVELTQQPSPATLDEIFRLVWANEPNRFRSVIVGWAGEPVVRTYDELAATLGPRPEGFDQEMVESLFLNFGGFGYFPVPEEQARTATHWLKVFSIAMGAAIVVGLIAAFTIRPRQQRPLPS